MFNCWWHLITCMQIIFCTVMSRWMISLSSITGDDMLLGIWNLWLPNLYWCFIYPYGLQCSNIFLTKDQDIRLGNRFLHSVVTVHLDFMNTFGIRRSLSRSLFWYPILMWCMLDAGDFGLAKMLTCDDLASSVSVMAKTFFCSVF